MLRRKVTRIELKAEDKEEVHVATPDFDCQLDACSVHARKCVLDTHEGLWRYYHKVWC
jgi:hypothetical protein